MAWPLGRLRGPKVMLNLHTSKAKQLFSLNNEDISFPSDRMTTVCSHNVQFLHSVS